ncbi:hypothetical protein ACMFMG_010046 [Clarireedia jacksonii]
MMNEHNDRGTKLQDNEWDADEIRDLMDDRNCGYRYDYDRITADMKTKSASKRWNRGCWPTIYICIRLCIYAMQIPSPPVESMVVGLSEMCNKTTGFSCGPNRRIYSTSPKYFGLFCFLSSILRIRAILVGR